MTDLPSLLSLLPYQKCHHPLSAIDHPRSFQPRHSLNALLVQSAHLLSRPEGTEAASAGLPAPSRSSTRLN